MARSKPSKTKIKNYLKAHGHPAGVVDGKKLDTPEQIRQDLAELHGITRAEYARAGV